nr:rRNA 2'-O-methyltransferase fibrillarin-like [Coffea arabica]
MLTGTSSNDEEGSREFAVKKPRALLSLDLNILATPDQPESSGRPPVRLRAEGEGAFCRGGGRGCGQRRATGELLQGAADLTFAGGGGGGGGRRGGGEGSFGKRDRGRGRAGVGRGKGGGGRGKGQEGGGEGGRGGKGGRGTGGWREGGGHGGRGEVAGGEGEREEQFGKPKKKKNFA